MIAPDVILAELADAAALAALRCARPGTAILAIVPDPEAELVLLAAGADDVICADAAPALRGARFAALCRRVTPVTHLVRGNLVIDLLAHTAARSGRALVLLPREYALLLHFARRPGITVTRAQLLEAVWGLDFDPGTNVIEVHVSRLRAKLDRGFAAPMLLTDKGRGYRLVVDPAIAALDRAG